MRIAVAAASGNLGSHIVKASVALLDSDSVVALARTPEKAEHLGVEVRKASYDSQEEFTEALAGIDALLVVSGNAKPEDRIGQHRNVFSGAKAAGVRRIVYTSILGPEADAGFSPIVQSNRQTEVDLHELGVDWIVGRNGLYVEPDIEYLDRYREAGKISNCAGDGRCAYVAIDELAKSYAKLLADDVISAETLNLCGPAITQAELCDLLNDAFGTSLVFEDMSVEAYKAERVAEHGEYFGSIIAGIYEGIRAGTFDVASDIGRALGRDHVSWSRYFERLAT